jgi:hypothetical protein
MLPRSGEALAPYCHLPRGKKGSSHDKVASSFKPRSPMQTRGPKNNNDPLSSALTMISAVAALSWAPEVRKNETVPALKKLTVCQGLGHII